LRVILGQRSRTLYSSHFFDFENRGPGVDLILEGTAMILFPLSPVKRLTEGANSQALFAE